MNFVSIEEAAERMSSVKRMLVLGCSGSGKSRLSQRISAYFDLPYISMDREVYWLPGWELRERDDRLAVIKSLAERERWVMDGTNPETMSLRLSRAEFAIWMRPPRWMSVWGVLSRWLRNRGRVRPEMAEGCPEKMDPEFLSYVWNFEKTESPRVEEQFALHGQHIPVLMLKSRKETARLLALLEARS